MQSVIKPVSELENNIKNNYATDEQRAKVRARLREGELNPNNKNRQVCAREYLLSVKKRIRERSNVKIVPEAFGEQILN